MICQLLKQVIRIIPSYCTIYETALTIENELKLGFYLHVYKIMCWNTILIFLPIHAIVWRVITENLERRSFRKN